MDFAKLIPGSAQLGDSVTYSSEGFVRLVAHREPGQEWDITEYGKTLLPKLAYTSTDKVESKKRGKTPAPVADDLDLDDL